MQPDPRTLLSDIESAAADIVRYVSSLDRQAYTNDDRTQAAVERKFEIIGEAINRLHQSSPEIVERIPRWRKVIDFRNLLTWSRNVFGTLPRTDSLNCAQSCRRCLRSWDRQTLERRRPAGTL